jgi:hypothetical protein
MDGGVGIGQQAGVGVRHVAVGGARRDAGAQLFPLLGEEAGDASAKEPVELLVAARGDAEQHEP